MFNNPLLQQFQQKMADVQAALETKTVTEETGGGMVRATVTGGLRLAKLEITPEALVDTDAPMLEDLIITAVNRALDAARAMAAREMAEVTKGMLPPGMF